jgi:site-specific DNA-cytosine methylase
MTLHAAEAFSGAGLLTLAFKLEGVEVHEVCELNKWAVKTLSANFGDVVNPCDATRWTPPSGLDVLLGGPPCQPWSGAGKGLGPTDPRDMFPQIVRWARESRPRLIVMENDGSTPESRSRAHTGLKPGIFSPAYRDYFSAWWAALNDAGYEGVTWALLAADYGTPQLRPRVVFVAWPHGSPLARALSTPPPITHAHPDHAKRLGLMRWTAGSERLLGGCCNRLGLYSCAYLNNVDGACEDCGQGNNYVMAEDDPVAPELAVQTLAYMMRDPKRIHKHKPADKSGSLETWLAPTMVADLRRGAPYGMVVDVSGFVTDFSDPREYEFLRRMTVRECAKIMDLPQWYQIEGPITERYRQVGNGVPVNVGRSIARHVLRAFGEPVLPAHQERVGLWPLADEDRCYAGSPRMQRPYWAVPGRS